MRTPDISFEFFPPKTEAGVHSLLQTAAKLTKTNPHFFSVTFGAAGSAQTFTPDTVFKIHTQTNVPTAPHISCVAATKETIRTLLHRYQEKNISRLVVLRGDKP